MSFYNKFSDEHNVPFESDLELEQWPNDFFAKRLAKATGISIWHARTALQVNGVTGGHNV